MEPKVIEIQNIKIGGNNPIVLIAGPCVIETEEIVLQTADRIKRIAEKLNIPFIFKSSYAKDNRSSVEYYYGPGVEKGVRILEKVKKEFGVPVLSDVHYPDEVPVAAEVLDIIQIPAFLSMQTRLALTAARTGKVINVKKGQFLAPQDMKNVVKKIESTGNDKILLTERGTFFGYHNLVVDMRSLKIMRDLGYPVIFDVTHTVRVYGIPSKDPSGGRPEFIFPLARAGVAVGIDAIFIETHPDPSSALSDASSMLHLDQLESILIQIKSIDDVVKEYLRADCR